MQKKKEDINEKSFESIFNDLNDELSNNSNMDRKQELNDLAEKIDNLASKINKKKEKKNNNSSSNGSNSQTSGENINKINYIDDKGNNPNIKNIFII